MCGEMEQGNTIMRKSNKLFGYIRDKAFYIALALCIVGATAAAWVTANRTIGEINRNNQEIAAEQSVSGEEKSWPSSSSVSEQQTVKEQKDVSKPSSSSTASSSSSASSASAGSVVKPAESSAAPQPSQTPQTISYIWPIEGGKVIEAYSDGQLVKNKTLNVWRVHDGVDIAGESGAPVKAVGDGTIQALSSDPLWGGMIQLEHPDGRVTVYHGVTADLKLKVGQKVLAGDILGTVGQIPAEISMEPHIHLVISKNGKTENPESLLAK